MFKHTVTRLFRSIRKGTFYEIINIFNLVIGFTAFISLSIVVNHELTYDTFNRNYSRIYRVQTRQEDSYPVTAVQDNLKV